MQGQKLGKYVIEELIGSGGMASVYLATHQALGSKVAIKILKTEYSANPEIVERFLKEARTAAKLKHPNIVRVHDVDQAGSLIYFVMDYIKGRSLKTFLAEQQALPEKIVIDFSLQVLSALTEAHARGVVHRDIKPDNIIIDHNNQAHITDFGIAKATAEADLTQTGVFLGTPRYASPEQIKGQTVDLRSDLYSWSVVMYEMVTGQFAFKDTSITTIIFKVINEILPPPAAILASVNTLLSDTISKGMAKNADDRFHSGLEMIAALQKAAEMDFSDDQRAINNTLFSRTDAYDTSTLTESAAFSTTNTARTKPPKSLKRLLLPAALAGVLLLLLSGWQTGLFSNQDQNQKQQTPTAQQPENKPVTSFRLPKETQKAETLKPKTIEPVTTLTSEEKPAKSVATTSKLDPLNPVTASAPVKQQEPPAKKVEPKKELAAVATEKPKPAAVTASTTPKQQPPVIAAPKPASKVTVKPNSPALSARFNRTPACFLPGSEARIMVQSEAGAYIYLLNLAADQSVSLLYPSAQLPEKKLSGIRFEFPPAEHAETMKLQFYPLVEGMMSRESIHVISSFAPLDFSSVIVAATTSSSMNQWQKTTNELARLKKIKGWSEQILDYWVGPECPN